MYILHHMDVAVERVPNDLSSESGCTEWSIHKLLDLVTIWKHSGKLLDLVTNWKHSEFVGLAPVRRDEMEDWRYGDPLCR